MSNKIKNPNLYDKLAEVTQQAGLVLMTAAFTLSLVEIPEHSSKIVVPNQPALAMAGQHQSGHDNSMRREKEETHPHHMSYSIAQRTPSRARSI